MPNWVFSQYNIEGSKEELDVLEKNIEEAEKMINPDVDFDFWFGYLIVQTGLCTLDEVVHSPNPRYRGAVEYWERMTDNQLQIGACSAHIPMHEPVIHLVKKFAPHAGIFYYSEEPNVGLYEKDNPDIEDYLLDIRDKDRVPVEIKEIDTNYFFDEEMKDLLQEIFSSNEENTDFLVERFNKEFAPAAYIYKYETVPLDYEPIKGETR